MANAHDKPLLIALDCDGVLLDYGKAYSCAWGRAFGKAPTLSNASAYWPQDRWGVPLLSGAELERFRAVFDELFWSTIPPVTGALEACHQLVRAGFTLVCVTALDERNLNARRKNFRDFGFPLVDVIATPHSAPGRSPKADALNALKPVAFVDDFAPYLEGVDESIHKALILRDPEGSPNVGQALELANSTHANLQEFAEYWCSEIASKRDFGAI